MYLSRGALISGDAGHNCYPDSGIVGIGNEDECTKTIWNCVQAKLMELGFGVKDCTPWGMSFNSVGASLSFRVKTANHSASSIHLSIHLNSGGGRGVECWVSEFGGRAEKFANQICNEINKLGYVNRGVKSGNIYLLKYTQMPCVLIKCCFVDSEEDMSRYNPNLIAKAIVKAITGLNSKNTDDSDQNANYSNLLEKYNSENKMDKGIL